MGKPCIGTMLVGLTISSCLLRFSLHCGTVADWSVAESGRELDRRWKELPEEKKKVGSILPLISCARCSNLSLFSQKYHHEEAESSETKTAPKKDSVKGKEAKEQEEKKQKDKTKEAEGEGKKAERKGDDEKGQGASEKKKDEKQAAEDDE